jgi:hypothetical protein
MVLTDFRASHSECATEYVTVELYQHNDTVLTDLKFNMQQKGCTYALFCIACGYAAAIASLAGDDDAVTSFQFAKLGEQEEISVSLL